MCRSTARLQHFCIDVRARSSGQYYISNPQTNSLKHFVLKVAPLWMWSHWRMDSSRCFLILRSWDFFSSSVAVNTNWTVSLVPRGSWTCQCLCVRQNWPLMCLCPDVSSGFAFSDVQHYVFKNCSKVFDSFSFTFFISFFFTRIVLKRIRCLFIVFFTWFTSLYLVFLFGCCWIKREPDWI